jgi:7-cyano-7-deazaguanine synthase in queuosine biosynthesis
MEHDNGILLASGGIDSAFILQEYHKNISTLLFIDYGHPANHQERMAVYELASEFRKPVLVEKLPLKSEMGEGASIVPARNLAMTALAANIAASTGKNMVAIGAILDDYPTYEDCGPVYLNRVSLLTEGFGVRVWAPLLYVGKKEVLKKIRPEILKLTWSCYKDGPDPCGECGSCISKNQS